MKKILTILSVIAAASFVFASCNLNDNPVFDDNDAFVAFDKAAVTCEETDDIIEVSVTLASIAGLSSTVSYEAVDATDEEAAKQYNLTAKNGEDFELLDGRGILDFDSDNRTQTIKVRILPHIGEYTKDLKFMLRLKDTGDVNASMETTCIITITDLDHPLAALLGNYTFSGKNTIGGAEGSWDCPIIKDETDDHVCWFFNIGGLSSGWCGWDICYYGVVDEALETITIPVGQENSGQNGSKQYLYQGHPILLTMLDANQEYYYTSGNITAEIVKDGTGAVTGLNFNLDETEAGEGAWIFTVIDVVNSYIGVAKDITAVKY